MASAESVHGAETDVVALFKRFAELPTFTSGSLVANGDVLTVTSGLSHTTHSTSAYEREASIQTHTLVTKPGLRLISSSTAVPLGKDVLHQSLAPSGRRHAVLRKLTKDGGLRVNFFEGPRKLGEAELAAAHFDALLVNNSFGAPSWSVNEDVIAFTVAEPADDEGGKKPEAKFEYAPAFGETMPDRRRTAIYVARVESGAFALHKVIDSTVDPALAFGQPAIVSIDDAHIELVATAYSTLKDGTRLGFVYCTNRPAAIYRLRVELPSAKTDDDKSDAKPSRPAALVKREAITRLTSLERASWSPRISRATQELLFLSAPLTRPHASCVELRALPLGGHGGEERIVVGTEQEAKDGAFAGLYLDQLPASTISGSSALLSSTWGSRLAGVSVDIASGSVTRLAGDAADPTGSVNVLAAKDGYVLAVRSNVTTPPELVVGRHENGGAVAWTSLVKLETGLAATATVTIETVPAHAPSEVIIVQPSSPRAVITAPHGGPHGSMMTTWSPGTAAMILGGRYALAMSNYPGSTGMGQATIDRLASAGGIGTLDVLAIRATTQLALAKTGAPVSLYAGGSHSGFTGAHLETRFPALYSAVVLRNPVTDLTSMFGVTDIPDWCHGEIGLDYPLRPDHPAPPRSLNQDEFKLLHASSPSTHIRALSPSIRLPPTLLLLGASDKRVPYSQGLAWYHTLRGRGDDVRCLVFEDQGHPLESVEAQLRGFEAQLQLFERAIASSSLHAGRGSSAA